MKKIIIAFLFSILCQLNYGQNKKINIETYVNGDTTYWYKYQMQEFNKANLENLIYTKDSLHFRFSSEHQAIEIWTKNYKDFFGTLTNYTRGNTVEKKEKEQFFSQKIELNGKRARQIYKLFSENLIFSIPTQDSIKNWESGEDGITYFIELSTPNYYSFKEYWTPSCYEKDIKEAKKLVMIINKLDKLVGMNKSFNNFIYSLPKGTYEAGGLIMISTE